MKNYSYKLSDNIIKGDQLSENIFRKKHKLYSNIKKFAAQQKNDGIFSENIVRMVFDGINLNHFHKNHPYVDVGIVKPIPGITKENEIMSVKSTINFKKTATLLADSKAIKIESLFSYVLFAHYNYDINYVDSYISPVTLLKKGIFLTENKDVSSETYKKIVNITTYYLMFHNKKGGDKYYIDDINNCLNNQPLYYGTYEYYKNQVLRRLVNLKTPISIALCYIESNTKEKEDTVCVIKKTEDILLNKFWLKLLDIWCNREYFGKGVVKYLRYDDIANIYNFTGDFPIEIKIGTGDYKLSDYSNLSEPEINNLVKTKTKNKVDRLYVATKLKDADFKGDDENVNNTISNIIDVLEEKPKLYTKFNAFIDEAR